MSTSVLVVNFFFYIFRSSNLRAAGYLTTSLVARTTAAPDRYRSNIFYIFFLELMLTTTIIEIRNFRIIGEKDGEYLKKHFSMS